MTMQTMDARALSPQADRFRQVQRWPSELPLFLFSVFVSIPLWILLFVSIFGAVYAVGIALFLFLAHVAFVAHVRGNGVRLGPEQFPQLHERVERLARDMGIVRLPDVYLIQAGGVLNALATKFLGGHLIVLYTELLDACGDDEAARDMIVAHELGHIHCGHLRWRFLTLPALLVPFLGHALSRAREYTCDRYGHAGAGDHDGALRGLTILAAGPRQAKLVNRLAFVRQRTDLETGWMTIGQWLSTHPPLTKRLGALDPALAATVTPSSRGVVRALAILGAVWLVPAIAMAVVMKSGFSELLQQAALPPSSAKIASSAFRPPIVPSVHDDEEDEPEASSVPAIDPVQGKKQVEQDLLRLSALIESERAAGRPIPWNEQLLRRTWQTRYRGSDFPDDPFDPGPYGYDRIGEEYLLWSSGPDGRSGSADDIVFDSRSAVPAATRRIPATGQVRAKNPSVR